MSDAPAKESFTNNRQTKNEIFSSCYQKEFELTTHNALRLLQESGFQTDKDWFQLMESLEVPLDTRRKLNLQAEKCQNYNMALEEGLDWFIANNQNPSWMTLINAVERCNRNVAKTLKSKLELQGNEEPAAAAATERVLENSPIEEVENTCFKLTQVIQIVLLASFLCWMFGFWIGLAMSLITLLTYLLYKLIYFSIKCILDYD